MILPGIILILGFKSFTLKQWFSHQKAYIFDGRYLNFEKSRGKKTPIVERHWEDTNLKMCKFAYMFDNLSTHEFNIKFFQVFEYWGSCHKEKGKWARNWVVLKIVHLSYESEFSFTQLENNGKILRRETKFDILLN